MEISKEIVSKEDLHKTLQNEEWGELWVILVAHAINRFMYRYGIKSNKNVLVEKAEKEISEVLSLIFVEDKRNWNRAEYPTLKEFICSVIDSHLYNSITKNNKEVLKPELVDESQELSHEDNLSYEELKEEVFKFLENENATDEEILIFECMADGILKPLGIKEDLGISDADFHNAWRRLKNKLLKLRIKLS